MMEEEKIRILLVQPGKHPVEKTIPHTLKTLQELVQGTTEIVYPWPDQRIALVCNDESKLTGQPLNRVLPEIQNIIAGDFFLCGLHYTNNGSDLCSLSPDQMEKMKERFHDPYLFAHTASGIRCFKTTPTVYAELMGRHAPKNTKEKEER